MLNGDRGSLDIKRAAKRKPTVVGADEDDSAASQVQSPPGFYRSEFLSDAKLADRMARYDGPLEPGWAAEFAALAREVVASGPPWPISSSKPIVMPKNKRRAAGRRP